jgi:hypothetical protein
MKKKYDILFLKFVPVPYVFTMFRVVPLYLVLSIWVVWIVKDGLYIYRNYPMYLI